MSEFASPCPWLAQRLADQRKTGPDSIDVWLERLHRLRDDELESLTPLVLADSPADTLRKLIRMCILLAHPERALDNWLGKSCDDLLRQIYQLRMVAIYLTEREQGNAPAVITFEQWCTHILAGSLHDEEGTKQAVRWFAEAGDGETAAGSHSGQRAEHPEDSASGEAAPIEEITEEETSRIERKRQAATALQESPANSASNGVMH